MRPAAILQMRGASAASSGSVAISAQSVEDVVADPANATASYTLSTTGEVVDHDGVTLETWLLSGVVADYQVRATLASGTSMSAGTVGSWLALSSSRTWSQTRTTVGTRSGTLTIEIRDVATSTIIDSASVTITAEVL
jgi:hypothetical protein